MEFIDDPAWGIVVEAKEGSLRFINTEITAEHVLEAFGPALEKHFARKYELASEKESAANANLGS